MSNDGEQEAYSQLSSDISNTSLWADLVTGLVGSGDKNARLSYLLMTLTHPAFEKLQDRCDYVSSICRMLRDDLNLIQDKQARGRCIDVLVFALAQTSSMQSLRELLLTLVHCFIEWHQHWLPASFDSLISLSLDFPNDFVLHSLLLRLLDTLLQISKTRKAILRNDGFVLVWLRRARLNFAQSPLEAKALVRTQLLFKCKKSSSSEAHTSESYCDVEGQEGQALRMKFFPEPIPQITILPHSSQAPSAIV